jgi:hypothetical protein
VERGRHFAAQVGRLAWVDDILAAIEARMALDDGRVARKQGRPRILDQVDISNGYAPEIIIGQVVVVGMAWMNALGVGGNEPHAVGAVPDGRENDLGFGGEIERPRRAVLARSEMAVEGPLQSFMEANDRLQKVATDASIVAIAAQRRAELLFDLIQVWVLVGHHSSGAGKVTDQWPLGSPLAG